MSKAEMRNEINRLCNEHKSVNHIQSINNLLGDYANVVIYGAGNAGCIFKTFLDKHMPEKKVACFLDRNAAEKVTYLGCPVYLPNDERLDSAFRENSVVVISLLADDKVYQEISHSLTGLGYAKTTNHYDYNVTLLNTELNTKLILTAFDMMEDEHSRDVYYTTLKAHATADYRVPLQSEGMTQYIDVAVQFRNKYKAFVDCGAYIGDTFEELIKHHDVEYYFGFEPDVSSFKRLAEIVNKYPRVKSVLFPLGVGRKNEFLKFSTASGGGSSMHHIPYNSAERTVIQVIPLDDVLKGFDNLMIKMDVEGAEISALEGAREIITGTKPDLAVCVYHRVSDLWQIPLILKEWVPEYKFYLRNHFIGTIETILYATI